nr:MAG TPA: hypothetical protein [Caudoviricetes sp.]
MDNRDCGICSGCLVLGLWLWRLLLVGGINNGRILERRVVRYSDLFEHRVYVRWTVVDDQR